MKKVLALVLALAMTFALVACTVTPEPEQPVATEPGNAEPETTTEPEPEGIVAPDGYPNGAITAICPYAAGGNTDLSLRTLLAAWEPVIGTNFTVSNVTGGSGTVAATQMMTENTDGYVIGQLTLGNMVTSTFDIEVEYTLDDFDFIGGYLLMGFGLVVNPDSEYQTLDALVEASKVKPLKVVTTGTTEIVALARLNNALGSNFESVYYNSTPDAIVDLLAGRIDALISGEIGLTSYLEAGQINLVASLSSTRFNAVPDVETIGEMGYPDCATDSVHGVGVPKGVDPAILEYLRATFYEAVSTEEFATSVAEICNSTAYPMTAEEYYNFLAEQRTELGEILPGLLG